MVVISTHLRSNSVHSVRFATIVSKTSVPKRSENEDT